MKRPLTRLQVLTLVVGVALLAAYLSFIPFQYVPLPLETALQRFAELPYLALRTSRRADVIANALMYLPLGILLARLLVPQPRGRLEMWVAVVALVVGSGWSALVEFAQFYFPTRTTSVNDIIASVSGSVLGAALWTLTGHRWHALYGRFAQGGPRAARAVLDGYVLLYFVLTFSPFDVVLSWTELARHWRSPLVGAWLAEVGCGGVPCTLRWMTEAALAAPLAFWWGLRWHRLPGVAGVILAGVALGAVLELAQLLVFSGVSQGASVVARATGFVVGAAAFEHRDRILRLDLRRHGRAIALLLAIPYLVSVAFVAGWFSGNVSSLAAAWERVGEVRWLPFYFIYFTTEYNAIYSTIVHLFLYAPVGVAVWLWTPRGIEVSPWLAALVGSAIAAVAEAGKLFVPPRHPDPTDVLIAAVAAGLTAAILRAISRPAEIDGIAEDRVRSPQTHRSVVADGKRFAWVRLLGVTALLAVGVSLFRFPVAQAALAVGFAAYGLLLTRVPLAYLWVVPIALPILDLAPWSGRFFWDEFDMLLLVTIGVRLVIGLPASEVRMPLPRVAVGALLAATAASALVALVPLPPLDGNAFTTYLSPFNALRVGKGVLWGVLLAWLVARDNSEKAVVERRLVEGLALALLMLGLAVVWERVTFRSVLALDGDYRVTGPISAMHIGGAYLDALLAALAPFALLLALRGPHLAWRALGIAALVLGFYAVVVTYSRAPLVAWVIGAGVFAVLWARRASHVGRAAGDSDRRLGFVVASAVLALTLAVGAFSSSRTLQHRFGESLSDLSVRDQHWRDVLGMMQWDVGPVLLGMGLGSFPRQSYLQHGAANGMGAYRFGHDAAGNPAGLILYGGLLYLSQHVGAERGATVEILVEGHADSGPEQLSVSICEKAWLMSSARCAGGTVNLGDQPSVQRLSLRVPVAEGWRQDARPIALSIHTASRLPVQVDRVEVRDVDGRKLERNGKFADALDHWFFTADGHLNWHPKNALLGIFFEQGLIGVFAWLGLAVTVLRRLVLADPRLAFVPALAAALAAVLFIALFDTVVDAPRLLILVLLLALFPLDTSRPVSSR